MKYKSKLANRIIMQADLYKVYSTPSCSTVKSAEFFESHAFVHVSHVQISLHG